MVADIVRGKTAQEALAILSFTTKKAAQPIFKLLNSAMANAKNNFQLDPNNLYISQITVDEAPKIKRWRARARGSANEIQKKTSHINLVLAEITKSKKVKKAKSAQVAAPVEEAEVKDEKSQKQEKPKLKADYETKKPLASGAVKKIFRRQVF